MLNFLKENLTHMLILEAVKTEGDTNPIITLSFSGWGVGVGVGDEWHIRRVY